MNVSEEKKKAERILLTSASSVDIGDERMCGMDWKQNWSVAHFPAETADTFRTLRPSNSRNGSLTESPAFATVLVLARAGSISLNSSHSRDALPHARPAAAGAFRCSARAHPVTSEHNNIQSLFLAWIAR